MEKQLILDTVSTFLDTVEEMGDDNLCVNDVKICLRNKKSDEVYDLPLFKTLLYGMMLNPFMGEIKKEKKQEEKTCNCGCHDHKQKKQKTNVDNFTLKELFNMFVDE